METETHYLYLLRHAARPAFKIGITNDVTVRVRTLETINKIDYADSVVYTGDRKCVRGMERALHYLFRDYRMKPWDRCDGKTEWFQSVCRNEVGMMIERLSDRSGIIGPFPLPPMPEVVPPQPKPEKPEYVKKRRTFSDIRLRGWTRKANQILSKHGVPAIDWSKRYVPKEELNELMSKMARGNRYQYNEIREITEIVSGCLNHLYDIEHGLVE